MAKSSQLYGELKGLLNQYNKYTPVDQDSVYRDLVGKVDAFRPQYNELGNLNAQAYAAPASLMDKYFKTYGTDQLNAAPSAASRMSTIMSTLGQLYGTRGAVAGSIDAQKGRLEDLAKTVMGTYQSQQDALWKKYQGLLPLYQAALSQEEAAASRAAAARAAAAQAAIKYPTPQKSGYYEYIPGKATPTGLGSIVKPTATTKGGVAKLTPVQLGTPVPTYKKPSGPLQNSYRYYGK